VLLGKTVSLRSHECLRANRVWGRPRRTVDTGVAFERKIHGQGISTGEPIDFVFWVSIVLGMMLFLPC
jgi:hypothetical protein